MAVTVVAFDPGEGILAPGIWKDLNLANNILAEESKFVKMMCFSRKLVQLVLVTVKMILDIGILMEPLY